MLKPTGLAVAGALMLAIVCARSNRRIRLLQVTGLSTGILIPMCIASICLIAGEPGTSYPNAGVKSSDTPAKAPGKSPIATKSLSLPCSSAFPLLVRGWVFRRDRDRDQRSNRSLQIFAIAWLLLEVIGVIMQKRMYAYHVLVLIPPAAILFAMIPRRTTARALAASLIPVMLLSLLGAWRVVDWSYRGQSLHPVSDYLLAHAHPGDAIWRENGARVLLETGLRTGSRYPLTFLFTNYDQAPTDYGRVILHDFARTKPAYIILFTNFNDWVDHQCDYYTELRRRPVRRAH